MTTSLATRKIDAAFNRERWQAARSILKRELVSDPNNHWLLTRLAMTYYEQRDYAKARNLSERAKCIAPACPLVRWDHACILDMLNETKAAVAEWKVLLKAGPRAIGNGDCGEGVPWAQSLLNDCRYRVAAASMDLKEDRTAVRYFRNYLTRREQGIPSIYDIREAREKLASCIARLHGTNGRLVNGAHVRGRM